MYAQNMQVKEMGGGGGGGCACTASTKVRN